MNIFVAGDVVGMPGRKAIIKNVEKIKEELDLDLIVFNIENSAAGSGVTKEIIESFIDAGVDAMTTGDHAFRQKKSYEAFENKKIIRPLNYSESCPGKGWMIVETKNGKLVAIINLLGRVFMPPIDCPFNAVNKILPEIKKYTNVILVDFHAEATSEKIAMSWFLDGKVSAVLGTHTHVQTNDACIRPNGTAYISDLGMTGPYDSILGRDTNAVLEHFLTGLPKYFEVADSNVKICGVFINIDETTGCARDIKTLTYNIT